MCTLSSMITRPICGFKYDEPLFFILNPNPVVPIDVLSEITTLLPIKQFFITTLFLIIEFLPISTPLEIVQFFPTSQDS